MTDAVTVERLEQAIRTVATMMVKHDMPLGPTIRFLEAERDKLQQETSDMRYAREILPKAGSSIGSNITKVHRR